MKVLKTASYKKFIKAQFDNIRTQEDLASEQKSAINFEIVSHLRGLLEENPNMDAQEMFQNAKYEFIDDGDYETAPDYVAIVESVIRPAIKQVQQEYFDSQHAADQASYEAEMSRDTHKQYGDGYQPLEDTSPCKDPNDRPRSNGKDKSHQGYPNLEKTNFYPSQI